MNINIDAIKNIINEFEPNMFYSIKGLILTEILVFLSLLLIDEKIVSNLITTNYQYLGYLIIMITLFIVWIIKRRIIPKCKSHIGILIAIKIESKELNKYREDVYETMMSLLGKYNLLNKVSIVNLCNYHSIQISDIIINKGNHNKLEQINRLQKISEKANAKLILSASLIKRKDNSIKEKYILKDINGFICHSPQPLNISQKLGWEFRSMLPEIEKVDSRNEFEEFKSVGEKLAIVSEYMLGSAAYLSQEYDIAIELLSNLIGTDQIKYIHNKYKTFPYLYKRIGIRLLDSVLQMTLESIQNKHFEKATNTIKIGDKYKPTYDYYLVKSIYEVMVKNNPEEALRLTYLAKEIQKDITWKYNEAFLLFNLGRYKEGLTVYKQIAKKYYVGDSERVSQIIYFIQNYRKENPNRIEFLFVLGYLYYKKIINYPDAYNSFELFIEKAIIDEKKYSFLIKKANVYLEELSKQMGCNKENSF